MFRVIVVMLIAAASAAVGQILLRKGMQAVGPLESYALLNLAGYFLRALMNPYVLIGTALNAIFYFGMLAALSWANVTVVLPLTAIEYAFAAVLAVAILKEVVLPMRWAGIAFVIIGVILISYGGGEEPIGGDSDRAQARISEGSTHLD